jgi:hypothetical protein
MRLLPTTTTNHTNVCQANWDFEREQVFFFDSQSRTLSSHAGYTELIFETLLLEEVCLTRLDAN